MLIEITTKILDNRYYIYYKKILLGDLVLYKYATTEKSNNVN